ncbi:RNA recognition motif domain containing protein [Babesia bovis T2Bo]|nr:RNA recognition motif domain containing protein [Babesia bovis T2Bo]EDO07975.1 RNA recognition motif domain containing protein [Babesia bovis T2Bo]|eukprot:XP_001611543.1 U2 small nuclear ribonucleoprotein B' [Babesia bovis T2Bo]
MMIPPVMRPHRPVPPRYTMKVDADPSIPPNQTIYIKNINERIKVDVLKAELLKMFGRFGKILDIVALTSFWRKGQAFIIFDNVESATNALHEMQGFVMDGHAMQINYAREKSDIIAKGQGTYRPRPEGPKKPRAIKDREQEQLKRFERLQHDYLTGAIEGMTGPGDPKLIQALQAAQITFQAMALTKGPGVDSHDDSSRYASTASMARGLPNRTLFVEGLPEGVSLADVNAVFARSVGFQEARVIAARKVAFIDFDNEFNAGCAMQALQEHPMGDSTLRISYAKR